MSVLCAKQKVDTPEKAVSDTHVSNGSAQQEAHQRTVQVALILQRLTKGKKTKKIDT